MFHHRLTRSLTRLIRGSVVLLGLAAAADARAAEIASQDSIPSDSTLSLAWVERLALERNPSLSAMREAWRETQARAEQAGALEDPMVEGMLAPQSLSSRSVEPAYRIGITQQLPIFGQRGLRRRAARAEGETAAYDFETARLDLLREVREAYFDYYLVCRGTEINRELVDLMSQSRRVALAKYSSGTVEQTDPLQAEILLLLSSDSDLTRLGALMTAADFRVRAVAHRSIFIETFTIHELQQNDAVYLLISELEKVLRAAGVDQE